MQYNLRAPFSEEDVKKLRTGDIVYLSGRIIGVRDATHRKMIDENQTPPISLENEILFHTAPSVKKEGDKYRLISTGPTTSTRVERYIPELVRKFRIRGIMGKGGMYRSETIKAMKENNVIYLAMVGGAAAAVTSQIKEIEAVYWEDLFPECIWVFRVENLGPLIVAIDVNGNNLYSKTIEEAKNKIDEVLRLG